MLSLSIHEFFLFATVDSEDRYSYFLDILKRELHDTWFGKRLIALFQKFINFVNNFLVSSKCINENQVTMWSMLFINEYFDQYEKLTQIAMHMRINFPRTLKKLRC